MTDGMVTIKGVDYSGVVGNVQVQQDGTFQLYLDFLEDWKSSLLQIVNTLQLIHKIFDTMGEEAFIIATDGSSGDTSMAFGWKNFDHEEKTLVQHAGPAFGQESSFQYETYDNENVMTWIKTQQQYPYDYSFNTLTPDWDIIAQTVAVLQRSDISGEFEHVKGHQDKDRKYKDLPLPAQMNVNVDILVVAF
eukprot:2796951-Ditylum_brightwellii.AAC.1